MPLLRSPALLHHAFFSAEHTSVPDSPARQALERAWERTGALGFDHELRNIWPVELSLPGAEVARPGLKILAARRPSASTGWDQAFAYRLEDTVGVSVLRSLSEPSPDWREAAVSREPAEGPGVFGAALLVLGLVPGADWDTIEAATARGAAVLGGELADELALSPDADGWSASWLRPREDVLVWEFSGVPGARRMLAVAREGAETTLLEWSWSGPRPGLPPFTGYLRHAAQLRYQDRILTESLGGIRESIREVDADCRNMIRMLDQDRVPTDRLLLAENALGLLQMREGGVVARLADVRSMTRTVKTAHRNLTAVLGPIEAGDSGGPLHRDSELARRVLEQLEAEQVFLSSALTKATEIGRISTAVVGGRLAARRENLIMFQTGLLSSLLMVLAAIQSFEYTVGMPGPLFGPVIALLGALALFVPPAVLHWRRPAPRRDRWAVLDLFFAGCVGAPLGWLAATGGHLLASRSAAPPSHALAAASAGVLLVALAFHGLRRAAGR